MLSHPACMSPVAGVVAPTAVFALVSAVVLLDVESVVPAVVSVLLQLLANRMIKAIRMIAPMSQGSHELRFFGCTSNSAIGYILILMIVVAYEILCRSFIM